MKSMRILSSVLFAAGTLLFTTAASAGGPEVFAASKCAKCHTVFNAGIKGDKKPIQRDLSGVGVKRDAAWMTKYLKKEVAVADKMHKSEWKGTDADLKALVDWLATQKKAVENPPAE